MAAAIMDVDITEAFSPERVAQVVRRFGLVARTSFDLTNAWGFTLEDHKRKAWTKIREESPDLLVDRVAPVHLLQPACCKNSTKQHTRTNQVGSRSLRWRRPRP